MRTLLAALLIAIPAAPAWLAAQQATQKGVTPDDLVAQLGSKKYAARQAAAASLDVLGAAALPALDRAALHPDPEVRRRAEHLRDGIESRLYAKRLLAGKKVRLKCHDVPVPQAVEALADQGGWPIHLDDPHESLAVRTVTLDTGAVTFWEALDLLCLKAGLSERPTFTGHQHVMANGLADPNGPPPNALVLTDGPTAPAPTVYAGALRLRVAPAAYATAKGETAFVLAVSPEGTLPWRTVESVTVHKAVDDRGQRLLQPEPFPPPVPAEPQFNAVAWDAGTGRQPESVLDLRSPVVRLTCGKVPAARLAEVRGVLTVRLVARRPLATLEDILQGAGKTFAVAGGSLRLDAVEVGKDRVTVVARVKGLPLVDRRGGAVLGKSTKKGYAPLTGTPAQDSYDFTLLDDAGRRLEKLESSNRLEVVEAGHPLETVCRATFARPAQGKPARLVFHGPAPVSVEVPFAFRDVPLLAGAAPR